jgi:hypothetical protein
VTVRLAGVLAPGGLTESQPVLLVVVAAVEKFTAVPLDVTMMVCWPELLAPAVVRLNTSAAGVATTAGVELTFRVTGICSGVPPFTGATVMVPV